MISVQRPAYNNWHDLGMGQTLAGISCDNQNSGFFSLFANNEAMLKYENDIKQT